jgi:hypothetical protein
MPAVVVAAAGAWLLVGAGLMKTRHPDGTSEAIRTLVHSNAPAWQSRLLGIVEIAVGAAFIALPGPVTAAALGLAYSVTFGSALILRQRDVDCGCFGADSARVGPSHLAITAITAVAAFALTMGYETYPGVSVYVLLVAGIPVALGCYALIAPLTALRSQLAEWSS